MQWIKQQIASRKTLDSKMYMIVLIVGTISTFASFIITCIEKLDFGAILSTFLCFAVMGVFWFMTVAKDMEQHLHTPLMVVLMFGLLPLAWIFCGGIHSGMIVYFIGCLFLIVPSISESRKRVALFLISLIWLLGIVFITTLLFPGMVTPLSDKEWYLDVLMAMVVIAAGIFSITTLMVEAYETERKSKEALLEEMEALAKRDGLTGLFNRRELFERLEKDENLHDGHHFLIMVDIDFFKKINDTYGHLFGDKALKTVAQTLGANASGADEFAARYGGEEFVGLLVCENIVDAEQRAETIRQQVYELAYEEYPELHISISGGLVCAAHFENVTEALFKADELLYSAKQGGRNQIWAE